MSALKFGVILAVLGLLSIHVVFAQTHPAWLERGQKALEEKRYEDAETAFQWIIDREPDNAEVRYLMARALLGKGKLKAADRSIVRALRHDPENVGFLELQLEIGFPREPLEILRRTRRDELAAKILLIDSLSVLPNIQLGQSFMYEWLEWRGRITVDNLSLMSDGWLGSTRPARANMTALLNDQTKGPHTAESATQLTDFFEVGNQEIAGGTVVDLSPRAEKAYPIAEKYLQRALIRDPQNQRAYLHLARLYTTRPDMVALSKLSRAMHKHIPENHYTWLLRGYAQHHLGNENIAEQQFEEALKLMPDSVRMVYLDTERLMNREGLARKKKEGGVEADGFWAFRDPRFLTPENERLTEHYARLVYAELQFSEPKINLIGWDSERGEVYIRYGKPELEYYMSNAVAQCGAASYDQFHIFEYPDFRFVFGNLWPQLNQYVYYSPCSQVMTSRSSIGAQIDYVIIAKDNIDEKPEGYTYDAAGKRVDFPYLTSSFKGKDGKTDVYVPYGIPVQVKATQLEQTLSLHAGAFLLSEADGVLDENHREVKKIKTKEITMFNEASLWLDALHLTASPGAYALSVEFETESGAGEGFQRADLDVPDFSTNTLQLSDLLLAYAVEDALPEDEESAGLVIRDGLLIQPAPWGVFNNEQPMYLYFEMYNLNKNAENRSEYEIETVLVEYRDEKGLAKLLKRAFRGRAKVGVSVGFKNTSTSSDEGQYLILDTQDQPVGTYMLVMRVTDLVSKKTVETRRVVLLE